MAEPKIDLSKFPEQARAELRRVVEEEGSLTSAEYFRAESSSLETHGATDLSRLAHQIRKVRDQRIDILGADLFAEPGWDILLSMFISKSEGYRMGITDVTYSIPVPPTTGLRWVETLERRGLIFREQHPNDKRKCHIELTETGFSKMKAILENIDRHLYPKGT